MIHQKYVDGTLKKNPRNIEGMLQTVIVAEHDTKTLKRAC